MWLFFLDGTIGILAETKLKSFWLIRQVLVFYVLKFKTLESILIEKKQYLIMIHLLVYHSPKIKVWSKMLSTITVFIYHQPL